MLPRLSVDGNECVPRTSAGQWCLLLLVATVSGCGFQLRDGGITLPPLVDRYDVPEHPLAMAVSERLQARKPGAAAGSGIDVLFSEFEETRRARTLTAGIQAAEYELAASMRLEARRGDDVLLPARTLRVRRVYVRDPANLLGNEAQEDVISEDLRADLAAQAIRMLEALAARP